MPSAPHNFPITPPPAPAPNSTRVKAIHGWRRALLFPLGLILRAWSASLRFEASPAALRLLSKSDQPVAFVLWHNRLILTSEIFRRYRRGRTVYGLVSASKDGAWLSAFFSLVGIRTVRGSSSQLGREAVNALVEVMRAGHDIGITPDGPRGPLYEFKAGGLIVARRVHAPLLLLGASFESAWQLRSWDRFYLPKPFSRVFLRCEWIPTAALHDRDQAAQTLRARLLAMNSDATSARTSHEPVV
ncbi:lysophospholipid acyltransferase family protein [Nibricoccus aquaticus]|uniref:lysophospholipid acyltransferase family protein n=1 Tax=Nibricoccus aquaticus TaxID=2576891 RepID=UPI0015866A6E|nr:lysophospholipid acyltransferase family protein [Nibricoccus aquaticus]